MLLVDCTQTLACMKERLSNACVQDVSWPSCKKYMGNVDAFLKSLLSFDKDNIPEACVDKVEKDYIKQSYFTPEAIRVKSAAAGGLCGWVVNICKYFRIYQVRLFTMKSLSLHIPL